MRTIIMLLCARDMKLPVMYGRVNNIRVELSGVECETVASDAVLHHPATTRYYILMQCWRNCAVGHQLLICELRLRFHK